MQWDDRAMTWTIRAFVEEKQPTDLLSCAFPKAPQHARQLWRGPAPAGELAFLVVGDRQNGA
jgi:hypothetical protein